MATVHKISLCVIILSHYTCYRLSIVPYVAHFRHVSVSIHSIVIPLILSLCKVVIASQSAMSRGEGV